ncbi:DUF6065 family protein [Rhizobium sp. SRDI969]|uniref:DUF6065 family protein n=1 Tax=Rhizobium sp. SRDI969 TaxID=3138252 RepID=UPI0021A7EEB0|nr:DUF6065 family protein [Rhizobium leguminosarum]UWM84286.1 DUF6065 family protein [Rhizobium leguminosarum bv. viciae]
MRSLVQPESDGDVGITFLRMIPSAVKPIPADSSASGTLPVRAYRYCEPIRLASQLGWYVFPPIDFRVVWDGRVILFKCAGIDSWIQADTLQFPKFKAHFNASAPAEVQGYSPPFISSVPEGGSFQLWSGLVLKTPPGVFAYVRAPINHTPNNHTFKYEGIVETDAWFGPLFTNIKILKTDTEIIYRRNQPILQVFPVNFDFLSLGTVRDFGFVESLDEFGEDDWAAYKSTIVDRVGPKREKGSYAKQSRKSKRT